MHRPRHPSALRLARLARLVLLAALVGALLVACGAPPAGGPHATLPLLDAAGSPLPALVDERVVPGEGGDEVHRLVIAEGALTLEGDRYHLRLRVEGSVDGMPFPATRWNDAGRVTEAGGVLAFASETIENVAFGGLRTGTGVAATFDLSPWTGVATPVALGFGER